MTNKTIFIGWFSIALGLALCWYPLQYLKEMQIGSAQLLFYAFSSATLCTIPWLVYQAKQWQGSTQSLLVIGLSGSSMLVFLSFSLLSGEAASTFSIFCASAAVMMLYRRISTGDQLNVAEYFALVMIVLASITVLFEVKDGFSFHWRQLTAFLSGLSCYFLYKLLGNNVTIPIASKLSVIFICSTWMSGMAIIFSPMSVSFPQENAALSSMLFGILCLLPIQFSLLKVLQRPRDKYFLLWLILTLVVSVSSVRFLR